jgi:hypothetical protein
MPHPQRKQRLRHWKNAIRSFCKERSGLASTIASPTLRDETNPAPFVTPSDLRARSLPAAQEHLLGSFDIYKLTHATHYLSQGIAASDRALAHSSNKTPRPEEELYTLLRALFNTPAECDVTRCDKIAELIQVHSSHFPVFASITDHHNLGAVDAIRRQSQ